MWTHDKMENSSTIEVVVVLLKPFRKDSEWNIKLVDAVDYFIAVDMQPLPVV